MGDHEGSGDASEEPGTVWLVLGFFDHGFSRRCLVHRHGRFVAFERAAAWIVTRSIPVVTAVSWTTASLLPRRMPCAPRTVTPQERALARLRVALSGSPREVSRDTRTCPPTASRLWCRQWHSNPCPSPSRRTSPRFNHTRLVC